MLCTIPLFLMITGVLQFPLSVLGNAHSSLKKGVYIINGQKKAVK